MITTGADYLVLSKGPPDPAVGDLTASLYRPAAFPFARDPAEGPILTVGSSLANADGASRPFVYRGVYDPTQSDYAGSLLPPSTTLTLASFSNTVVAANSAMTGSDRSLSDLGAGDHAVGLRQPAASILPGESAVGAALLASLTTATLGIKPADLTEGRPLVYKGISDPKVGRAIGLQLTPGVILGANAAATSEWGAVSLTFTSAALGPGSVITGTDYTSLSRSLSDLTSTGGVVTGWTLTYVTNERKCQSKHTVDRLNPLPD